MKDRIRVVFISRQNALRSVLAEACLMHLAPERFAARSCGVPGQIANVFHPAAVGALISAGMAVPTGETRDWNSILRHSPAADFVITLDEAVAQMVPTWPGQPNTAVWPFPEVTGSKDAEANAHAAIKLLHALRRRLELLVSLTSRISDRAAIRSDIRDLAYLP